ncbi:MAG: GYF domain-containing protein [Phycisphaerae bacterium]|nr:GYF domain-containing protein [Phycisphaerae bacterium]
MKEWFCVVGGKQFGPISEEALKQWIAEGRLGRADKVWAEGMAEWVAVTAVPELQNAISYSPPAATAVSAQPLESAPGAVTSMVCGIVGVCLGCAGLILGIIALKQQKKAMEYIASEPTRYGGQGYCTAGRVLGIIAIVFGSIWALYLLGHLLFWGLLVSAVYSGGFAP